ncbi:hypothetical protein HDK77DRAFT_455487 [Phyllosticta capitalensis]
MRGVTCIASPRLASINIFRFLVLTVICPALPCLTLTCLTLPCPALPYPYPKLRTHVSHLSLACSPPHKPKDSIVTLAARSIENQRQPGTPPPPPRPTYATDVRAHAALVFIRSAGTHAGRQAGRQVPVRVPGCHPVSVSALPVMTAFLRG